MPVIMKSLTFSRGATVNRGNFNSDRADLSVTMEFENENPDEVFEIARTWVKKKLAEEMKS